MARCKASLGVSLDEDTTSQCMVYADDDGGAPILAVSTSSAHLTLSVPSRGAVTETDVWLARDLLAAVQTYAAEVENCHAAHTARTVPSPVAVGD